MKKDVNPLTPLESKAPKLSKPKNSAAGIPALISTAKYGLGNMGVLNSLKNLAKVNDFDGFDCPGCAWPDPDDDRSPFGEYCENGMKAIAEEATNKSIDRFFFEKNSVRKMSEWSDFEIGGNTSGNAQTLDFDMNIVYDKDKGNTIRKAVGELTYPQQDGDCTPVFVGATNCRAKLDIYAFNEEDEEATNTTETANENRDAGDCDDDENYCVCITRIKF